jgi:5-methylcytosine-specific restriction protein A
MVRTLGPTTKKTLDNRVARTAGGLAKVHDYGSKAHRDWAEKVIELAGGQMTGRCAECGETGHHLVADHKIEVRDGGAKYDLANGQALCWRCHTIKTNRAKALRHVSHAPNPTMAEPSQGSRLPPACADARAGDPSAPVSPCGSQIDPKGEGG